MQLEPDDERLVLPQYDFQPTEGGQVPYTGGGLPLRMLDQFVLFIGSRDGYGWAAAGLEQLETGASLPCTKYNVSSCV